MNFINKVTLTLLLLFFVSIGNAQNMTTYNASEKKLFPSKANELLAAHGDTLMLISSQPNKKELWIYRASTDNTETYKAEIFYKPHLFSFMGHSLAFYDVIMNRFIFSKLENNALFDYMGDKLKGIGEESIGLSLPHFYFFNNRWLILSLAGYAYMDNKLFYGYLTEEGKWTIPPTSLFEYPDGLSQSFGLVKAYTSTIFNGRQIVCTEVSGSHPIAKENNLTRGLFVLTEINGDFTVNRHIPITDQRDSSLLSKDIPSSIELLDINGRLALIIKNENTFCAKIFSSDYKLLKQVTLTEGVSVLKHISIALANGFISTFSTAEDLCIAYVTGDGIVRKRWKIHTANMSYANFYCMNDKENFYVIINDRQANEVIRKTIPIYDLEK